MFECQGREMRKSPRTRASICVRRKQSIASSGRQTIGSLSLKEVLSTTGTPVRARIGLARDGLQPARAVDVRRRGNLVTLFRAHGVGQGHEWRRVRLFKIL